MSEPKTTKFVLDATMGWPFVFCPIELDAAGDIVSLVTGMNYIGDPPGKVIAIVHEDGQAAVERFCIDNADALREIGLV
jgi:hypothetical protein